MRLEYDPMAGAAYLRPRDVPIVETTEIASDVLMDLAADGWPVGFELLDPVTMLGDPPATVEFVILQGTAGKLKRH